MPQFPKSLQIYCQGARQDVYSPALAAQKVTVHSRCYAMNIVSVLYVEASQNRFGHVVSSVIITLASAASLVALFPPLGPSTVTRYLRADPLFVALVRLSASSLESNDSSSESLL